MKLRQTLLGTKKDEVKLDETVWLIGDMESMESDVETRAELYALIVHEFLQNFS
jgi:hypothetical protein